MAHVWEVRRRPGVIGDDWSEALFRSKPRALSAVAQWLLEGYTITGPHRRRVY
jgi:hypothetical protein